MCRPWVERGIAFYTFFKRPFQANRWRASPPLTRLLLSSRESAYSRVHACLVTRPRTPVRAHGGFGCIPKPRRWACVSVLVISVVLLYAWCVWDPAWKAWYSRLGLGGLWLSLTLCALAKAAWSSLQCTVICQCHIRPISTLLFLFDKCSSISINLSCASLHTEPECVFNVLFTTCYLQFTIQPRISCINYVGERHHTKMYIMCVFTAGCDF